MFNLILKLTYTDVLCVQLRVLQFYDADPETPAQLGFMENTAYNALIYLLRISDGATNRQREFVNKLLLEIRDDTMSPEEKRAKKREFIGLSRGQVGTFIETLLQARRAQVPEHHRR